jgi:hypothetical protein
MAGGILPSFLPETANVALPETAQEAEKFGKRSTFFSWFRSSIKFESENK